MASSKITRKTETVVEYQFTGKDVLNALLGVGLAAVPPPPNDLKVFVRVPGRGDLEISEDCPVFVIIKTVVDESAT